MKCQLQKKNITNLSSAEFAKRVVNVNSSLTILRDLGITDYDLNLQTV